MKITALTLQNFKRFTHLEIKNIPTEAKLVLLVGANGSGKSSVFDAFEWYMMDEKPRDKTGALIQHDTYYMKDVNKPISVGIEPLGFTKSIPNAMEVNPKLGLTHKNLFFGRPSMRIVPTLTNSFFDESVIRDNSDGPAHYIDFDTRFHNDVKTFTRSIGRALRDPLFRGKPVVDLAAIAQRFINPVNESLVRIFGKEQKTSIRIANYEDAGSTANEPPQLIFAKGQSLINYDLLSHGEKQVIVILMNLIIRSQYFQDTIYYIDEMDVHLNTTLQYALLKEITENWIPENCQLWTASHSLGFIEYAKDADIATIIDFDNFNFDEKQTLEPTPKHLDDIFEIAIPRASIAKILGNRKIVLCENKNYELYSLMGLDDFVFTDVQNSNSVYLKTKRDKSLVGLRDRDFLTDNEITRLCETFSNYKILRYYCFENYLFHPKNMASIGINNFDEKVYAKEITALKNQHRHALVLKISESRKAYEEFRDGGIKPDTHIEHLSKALESDDFETFYPILSYKDYCMSLVNKYKVDKKDIREKLVQTEWFRGEITAVLS